MNHPSSHDSRQSRDTYVSWGQKSDSSLRKRSMPSDAPWFVGGFLMAPGGSPLRSASVRSRFPGRQSSHRTEGAGSLGARSCNQAHTSAVTGRGWGASQSHPTAPSHGRKRHTTPPRHRSGDDASFGHPDRARRAARDTPARHRGHRIGAFTAETGGPRPGEGWKGVERHPGMGGWKGFGEMNLVNRVNRGDV